MSTAAAQADAPKLVRSLVTPEGVDLQLSLGSAGERAAAFLIDVVIIVGIIIVMSITALIFAVRFRTPNVAGMIWLAGFFFLRNAYFIWFELGRRGATPGKRALGLRVVAQRGGRLSADAVLARNLVREIEIFLPFTLLVAQGSLGTLMSMAGLLWTGTFALFPFSNRDRMRVGDLLAGTWVVHVPRRQLLPDLMDAAPAPDMAFTQAQVDAYGVRELETLEQVLRSPDPNTVAAVADRIRRKIGWSGREGDLLFLDAYYGALRRRLERRLLFGHRRRDKHDAG